MNPERLSVVVPAFVASAEAGEHLRHCLSALAATSPRPFEVVVVDDGSPEPLAWEQLPGLPIRWLRQDNAGPAAARNAGARAATGEVLVFVDADVVVPVDVFERLSQDLLRWPQAGAVWGTVTAEHPHEGLVSRYKNHSHRHFTLCQGNGAAEAAPESCETRHLTTMLAAVRRAAFDQIGGFDESFNTVSVEDVEFGRELAQAGLPVWLDLELQVQHRHRFTLMRAIKNDFHKVRRHGRASLRRRLKGQRSVASELPGERRQVRYLVSVPLGVGAVASALTGRWGLGLGLLGALAWVERDMLRYLVRQEGKRFALASVPLMAVERGVVAAALAAGAVDMLRGPAGIQAPQAKDVG